jgi:hypothetical protein
MRKILLKASLMLRETSSLLQYFTCVCPNLHPSMCHLSTHVLIQQLAKYIEPTALSVGAAYGEHAQFFAKWGMWSTYWWWQGICWAGIWTLGHEV